MDNYEYGKIESIYGENCFSESVMIESLPTGIFNEFLKVRAGKKVLSTEVAEVIANSMKDWALERGATHYTHWFQPLTGMTAEKHDSFISPGSDGTVLMQFSGKELLQGEPDASSFPSGGLRSTFEARGYTTWDTGSPAFLKAQGDTVTLCIPTAFVSYTGEALDNKVPLLRAMDALDVQARRVLKCLGEDVDRMGRVITYSGPEQEYFLVERKLYELRPDLKLAGRTVFGSMSAKGQEKDDHYFGSIHERVADFMDDVNIELWKLGISAKTQHNEVAPHQYELATVHANAGIGSDWNFIVLETLQRVANRHDLVCLIHEKPFAGLNGSGKHNNWSIGTESGVNLLEPGRDPHNDARFLLFLTSVIKAVDKYSKALRASTASSGNDHRLGAHEAPPAIISIFLGGQLHEILENLVEGKKVVSREGGKLEIGVTSLPDIPMDVTDRNRTSPFAFTGNRFEFRMVGSSQSVADPNTVLTVAMAEILREIADRLEKSSNVENETSNIILENYKNHRRVIYNGNGYSDEWVREAGKRGLPNIKNTPEALKTMLDKENIKLFGRHKVLSKEEIESRLNIYLQNYSMSINIEAGIMVEMANRLIYPSAIAHAQNVGSLINTFESQNIPCIKQQEFLKAFSVNIEGLLGQAAELSIAMEAAQEMEDDRQEEKAIQYLQKVVPIMEKLRVFGDALEKMVDRREWPYPGYEELLFNM